MDSCEAKAKTSQTMINIKKKKKKIDDEQTKIVQKERGFCVDVRTNEYRM